MAFFGDMAVVTKQLRIISQRCRIRHDGAVLGCQLGRYFIISFDLLAQRVVNGGIVFVLRRIFFPYLQHT